MIRKPRRSKIGTMPREVDLAGMALFVRIVEHGSLSAAGRSVGLPKATVSRRLADGGVGFADAGEHALKGKSEPVRLWQATRVLSGVGGD